MGAGVCLDLLTLQILIKFLKMHFLLSFSGLMKLNALSTRSIGSSSELFKSVLSNLVKGFFPRDVIKYFN